jgi:hypothetical protein
MPSIRGRARPWPGFGFSRAARAWSSVGERRTCYLVKLMQGLGYLPLLAVAAATSAPSSPSNLGLGA